MNEKIKELIAKATTFEKGPPNWDVTANTVIKCFDKEKFAELIIKEILDNALYGDEFEQARANVRQLLGVNNG